MKFACVGECMIEISNLPDGGTLRHFGGDTLNTAVYLARLGTPVDYITALGDDPYSDDMIAAWRDEGVGVDQVQRVPGAVPGLYMIRTDAAGERSFHYWRDQAPARQMFAGENSDAVARALADCDWIYFSGITLSILDDAGRERLINALRAARSSGAKVAFDGNYRPRGWASADEARAAFAMTMPQIDLALPTYDDEQLLHNDADPQACAARYHDAGVAEVVIKLGPEGAIISGPASIEQVPVPATITPVDTTAAGDSFNAGFLASRSSGQSATAAAQTGHKLAGTVIQHRGAIIPTNAMPKFEAN